MPLFLIIAMAVLLLVLIVIAFLTAVDGGVGAVAWAVTFRWVTVVLILAAVACAVFPAVLK